MTAGVDVDMQGRWVVVPTHLGTMHFTVRTRPTWPRVELHQQSNRHHHLTITGREGGS
jgi:hypothetical protein